MGLEGEVTDKTEEVVLLKSAGFTAHLVFCAH